jgi:hypothetical protein
VRPEMESRMTKNRPHKLVPVLVPVLVLVHEHGQLRPPAALAGAGIARPGGRSFRRPNPNQITRTGKRSGNGIGKVLNRWRHGGTGWKRGDHGAGGLVLLRALSSAAQALRPASACQAMAGTCSEERGDGCRSGAGRGQVAGRPASGAVETAGGLRVHGLWTGSACSRQSWGTRSSGSPHCGHGWADRLCMAKLSPSSG